MTMQTTQTDLNKTLWVKKEYLDKNRRRYKVDATGKTLGRLAAQIAIKLTGKHKAWYNDFWDAGDYIIVENAEKITTTGKKLDQKMYYSYSGYKGNVKSKTLAEMMQKKPTDVLWYAVRGMLPKNKLRDSRMKRVKIIVGPTTEYDHFKPVSL